MRHLGVTMSIPKAPSGLKSRGKRLWKQITEEHELDPTQVVILEECCRCADRLDELDSIIQGKGVLELMKFRVPDAVSGDGVVQVNVSFDSALGEARQQQNVFKQLLVSLRLADPATGKRPQQRGSRGAYTATAAKAGIVSSLDRARQARGG